MGLNREISLKQNCHYLAPEISLRSYDKIKKKTVFETCRWLSSDH